MIEVGKNIRALRKAFSQTQKQLAKDLGEGYTHQLISKYENGDLYPNTETLEKISMHFHVPIQDIQFSDLSSFELPAMSFNINKLCKIIESVFPLLKPEDADTTDTDYNKGYNLANDFYKSFAKQNMYTDTTSSPIFILIDSIASFLTSAKKHQNIESMGNFVILTLLLWIYLISNTKLSNNLRNLLFSSGIPLQKIITENGSQIYKERNTWSPHVNNYFSFLNPKIIDCLKVLKKSKYAEFADYCIFLKYEVGMVDISSNYSETLTVKSHLLSILGELENPYIVTYITEFLGIDIEKID